MNTQRPEWNDANNALVGQGLSVVTVAYLRRYVVHLTGLLVDAGRDVEVSDELATLLLTLTDVLAGAVDDLDAAWSPARCRDAVEQLGRAGETYRSAAYAGLSGQRRTLSAGLVADLLSVAQVHLEDTVRASTRPDGLFHSYNTLSFDDDGLHVHRLAPMLEGQVAVLGSGMLEPQQVVELVRALRHSPLYRSDQHSYQLYPDVQVPTFFERNTWDDASAKACPLLEDLRDADERRLVVQDSTGRWHFAPGIRHAGDVRTELDRLAADPRFDGAVSRDRKRVLTAFEEIFDHRSYTGRSGTFFAFEGLGSIYWHMVSKLLLGVQRAAMSDPAASAELRAAYEDVRHGLGYCKDPQTYGAFPTDPYSHTPAGRGARQPGMTGQVKEEVITRFAELGAVVEAGCIRFDHRLLRDTEWLPRPARFAFVDVRGAEQSIDLPAGSLAFTWCQVPFVLHRAAGSASTYAVRVTLVDGRVEVFEEPRIPDRLSAEVFGRSGAVTRVDVHLPG